jgi:two-component system phosphate regulon response regulator PhoB
MSTITGMAILVVDDDQAVRDSLRRALTLQGYDVELAGDGEEALLKVRANPGATDLLIVDVLMPRLDGLELTRRLRGDGSELPILMLTARGAESDRVQGLELGADDYLPKPFNIRELVLRVESVARRRKEPHEPSRQRLVAGDIALDLDAHLCFVDGGELPLTLQEFRLLAYLIQGRGRVRTRDELLADVWNASPELETRTVDTHVKRLRDKLGPAGDIIETVRGVGYRIREADAPAVVE